MLRARIITALIGALIVAGVVYTGDVLFLATTLLIALICGWEFHRMMGVGGYETNLTIILGLITLLLLEQYRSDLNVACIISLALVISLPWQLFRESATPTIDWALTLAGGLYIGWGMAHVVGIRFLADGLAWFSLTLLATWGSDTFAYLVGANFGRTKLWPRHSPNKTWEGLLGGIGGGLFGASLVAIFSDLGWTQTLIIGAIVPIIALYGDLAISMMKRQVGVKDTSNLMPGHGGFLDRADSFLITSVVVYNYALWSQVLSLTVIQSLLGGG